MSGDEFGLVRFARTRRGRRPRRRSARRSPAGPSGFVVRLQRGARVAGARRDRRRFEASTSFSDASNARAARGFAAARSSRRPRRSPGAIARRRVISASTCARSRSSASSLLALRELAELGAEDTGLRGIGAERLDLGEDLLVGRRRRQAEHLCRSVRGPSRGSSPVACAGHGDRRGRARESPLRRTPRREPRSSRGCMRPHSAASSRISAIRRRRWRDGSAAAIRSPRRRRRCRRRRARSRPTAPCPWPSSYSHSAISPSTPRPASRSTHRSTRPARCGSCR
jgi:hypothetical protein